MTALTDILFHLDEWLLQITVLHPVATYVLFFGIVFSESAFFPVAPFLPGDGLLFAIGVLAASGAVHLGLSILVLILGGVLGNLAAYKFGQWMGPTLFDRIRWLNQNHYKQANEFYQRHGYKAMLLSRFVPVVRALVPLIAGITLMNYRDFLKYNFLSVCVWVLLIVPLAYYIGHLPFIKNQFTWIVLGFALLSSSSVLFAGAREIIKKKLAKRSV